MASILVHYAFDARDFWMPQKNHLTNKKVKHVFIKTKIICSICLKKLSHHGLKPMVFRLTASLETSCHHKGKIFFPNRCFWYFS